LSKNIVVFIMMSGERIGPWASCYITNWKISSQFNKKKGVI